MKSESQDIKTASPDNARRNRMIGSACLGVVVGMVGLAYASVPLYRIFCQVTGYGGTTQVADIGSEAVIEETLIIRFDANVANDLNWSFQSAQAPMTIRIGETRTARYTATSQSSERSAGTAVFNVTPVWAGAYFFKIECFCFSEQELAAGETADMPVEFYVDPEIVDDPSFPGLSAITLSYTFFPEELSEPVRVSENDTKQSLIRVAGDFEFNAQISTRNQTMKTGE